MSEGFTPHKMRCAFFGPTPFTLKSIKNKSFSVVSAKPKSVMESSRTTRFVYNERCISAACFLHSSCGNDLGTVKLGRMAGESLRLSL